MTEINQTSAKSNSLSTSNTNTTTKPEFDHKFKLMMLGNYNTLIIIQCIYFRYEIFFNQKLNSIKTVQF